MARRHRRAGGVPMKTRRRVVDAIKDRGGLVLVILSRLPAACLRDSQIRLFLFSRLLRRRAAEEGALGRVRRRRGCPLAVLAVLLPPRARRPRRCRRSSVSTVPPAPLLWSSRRTRAWTAPGPRLPRRGGGAAATTASGPPCAACFDMVSIRFDGCRVGWRFWGSGCAQGLEGCGRRPSLGFRVPVGLGLREHGLYQLPVGGAACKKRWGKRMLP